MTSKEFAKSWVTHNHCDGDDRAQSGNADTHTFNSPELYELADEMMQAYELYLADVNNE